MREEHGLPVLPLPPCAPAVLVKQFNEKHSRTGPDPSNIQYNWRSPLGRCPWNRQATLLLAREYLELYREGRIKLKNRILPYDPKVDLKTLQKTIRQRVIRTYICWKGQDLPNNSTSPHRDDDDDTTAVPSTMQERAERKLILTRRRMRGIKVRIDYFLCILSPIHISTVTSGTGRKRQKVSQWRSEGEFPQHASTPSPSWHEL